MLRSLLITATIAFAISTFAQIPLPEGKGQVFGHLTDAENGMQLQGTVEVFEMDAESVHALTDTNSEGKFSLLLDNDRIYDLKVDLEGYKPYSRQMSFAVVADGRIELKIELNKKKD